MYLLVPPAVRKKWPQVQEHFRIWASERGNLRLGNTLLSRVSEDLAVFHMVAQHGYGPSPRPRIRYGALQSCLNELSHAARQDNSSVHMPRIGCGEAGGSWHIVGEMIKEALGNQGTPVTIYDLSGDSGSTPKPKQLSVFDSAEF